MCTKHENRNQLDQLTPAEVCVVPRRVVCVSRNTIFVVGDLKMTSLFIAVKIRKCNDIHFDGLHATHKFSEPVARTAFVVNLVK